MATQTHENGEVDQQAERIEIPRLAPSKIEVPIVGHTQLCMHRWTEKAKKQIRDDQTGKAKEGQDPKDPRYNFRASAYILEQNKREGWNNGDVPADELTFGFPAIGFKKAMVRGYKNAGLGPMTDARGAFYVYGVDDDELVTIKHPPEYPEMREDMVTVGRGTADIRYRPTFKEWSATLRIEYMDSMIGVEQVAQALQHAGHGVGVGEYRPEKGGQWGKFRLADGGEQQIKSQLG
jgi:hypothetical protein